MDRIRNILSLYGEVDDTDHVNDPKKGLSPYTLLEYNLLRLSVLAQIAPRVLKSLTIDEMKKFPSIGVKNLGKGLGKKKVVNKQPTYSNQFGYNQNMYGDQWGTVAQPASYLYPQQQQTSGYNYGTQAQPMQQQAWNKGTGYGFGSQSGWDINAYIAAEQKRDSEVQEICQMILTELSQKHFPKYLFSVLEQSCFVPFIASYLRNDSLLDMQRHDNVNRTILSICDKIGNQPNLVGLFLPLKHQSKSLQVLLNDLGKMAANFKKWDSAPSASSSTQSSWGSLFSFNTPANIPPALKRTASTSNIASVIIETSKKGQYRSEKAQKADSQAA